MVKHPEQRVGVLVDVANLYHSARNLYGKKVNFRKVLAEVVGQRKLIRAVAYVIRSDNNDEMAFFEALSQQGFEVVMKDLQVFPGGVKKGDWDVGISIDAIK
ncbi:MAG TPA: NYN domain-containing protein, partial [bacterium]|nr:NYN domain-containing protein [bacterium]